MRKREVEVGSGSGSGEKNDKLFTSTELVYSFFGGHIHFIKKMLAEAFLRALSEALPEAFTYLS